MHRMSYSPLILFICTFITMPIASLSQAGMDITAYEYQRKFGKTLSLGECPFRQEAKMVNETIDVQDLRCTSQKKGVVRNLPRALSDTMNQLITSSKGVIANLGLCGGEAASYLGILHDSECMAVDISGRLTFSDRTVVRAFVGYYRTSLDILDTTEVDVRDGMESYYEDKYYVKIRSYGTLEIIFVQFRFKNNSQAAIARNYTQADPKMSSYMAEIKKRVGEPKSVKIISLSTASKENYKIETSKEWNRALRYVKILELTINNTREKIENNKMDPPHLKYKLYPFLPDDVSTTLRVTDPIVWEKASLMEVQMKQAIMLMKKLGKKCKGNNKRVCRRVRSFRRTLKTQLTKIHNGRSAWMNLTTAEKESFVARFSSQVATHTGVANTLNKAVRKLIRRQKLEELRRKRHRSTSANQIPTRQHRIRHLKQKLKKRKNRKIIFGRKSNSRSTKRF